MLGNPFPSAELFGGKLPRSLVPAATDEPWNPNDYTIFRHLDVRRSDLLFQDTRAGATAVTALDDVVGAIGDINPLARGGSGSSALDLTNSTGTKKPLYKPTHYASMPYVLGDGTDDFLRNAITTTVNGAASSATQTFASAANFQVGDMVYFGTTAAYRTITGIATNTVTLDSTISTTNGETITLVLQQPFSWFILGKLETATSGVRIFDSNQGNSTTQRVYLNLSSTTNRQFYAGTAVAAGSVDTSTPHLISGSVNGASSIIVVDGVQVGATVNPGSNPWFGLTLFADRSATPANAANYALGELVIVKGAQTLTELQRAWTTYFKPGWGL